MVTKTTLGGPEWQCTRECIDRFGERVVGSGRCASRSARAEIDRVWQLCEPAGVSAPWAALGLSPGCPLPNLTGLRPVLACSRPCPPGSTNEAEPSLRAGRRREPRGVVSPAAAALRVRSKTHSPSIAESSGQPFVKLRITENRVNRLALNRQINPTVPARRHRTGRSPAGRGEPDGTARARPEGGPTASESNDSAT